VLPLSWQLRQVRERLCLSQEDLAARTGLSVRTIRNIESGRVAVPRPASLRLLRGIIDEAAVIPRWACPSTLPADVTDFCGRRDEFTEVADHLRSARTGMPVVAIHGRPGVGKTTLLVHLGHRFRREFPDGQLYLHLGGRSRPVPPFTALDRLLRVLLGDGYVVPAELAARAERFRQAHRALGEIDAAREYLDFALDLVKVLGDKVGQGYIKLELGHLAHAAGALALAEARFREARLAPAAADRPTGEAKALGALARVQTERGLPGTASRTLHEALATIEGIQAGNLVTELHRDLLLLTL